MAAAAAEAAANTPFTLMRSSRGSLRFYNRREPQEPQIYRQMNRAFPWLSARSARAREKIKHV